MTVRQAQAQIDSAEFNEWRGYYQLEPFGAEAEDERHGVHMALIANAQRGKDTEPYTVEDFMLGATAAKDEEEPVLLEDDVAQADLILTEVFRLPPRSK
jgi:hypothetical protein